MAGLAYLPFCLIAFYAFLAQKGKAAIFPILPFYFFSELLLYIHFFRVIYIFFLGGLIDCPFFFVSAPVSQLLLYIHFFCLTKNRPHGAIQYMIDARFLLTKTVCNVTSHVNMNERMNERLNEWESATLYILHSYKSKSRFRL